MNKVTRGIWPWTNMNFNTSGMWTGPNKYQIPYGVCSTDKKNQLIELKEKPRFNFFLNIGIYIIKNDVIKLIGNVSKKIDFPDLIKKAKQNKKKIGIYPIEENSWFDVGQWTEYSKTLEAIEKVK